MELAYCPSCKKQMQKRNSVLLYIGDYSRKPKIIRLDKCLRNDIYYLNSDGQKTLACCCGHGIYPMTIVCRNKNGRIYELFSNITMIQMVMVYRMTATHGR